MTNHGSEGRIRLTFGQVVTIIGLLMSVGAAWLDLRIQVTRAEAERVEQAKRTEEKIDRMQRDIDQIQQANNFRSGDFEQRLRALERRR